MDFQRNLFCHFLVARPFDPSSDHRAVSGTLKRNCSRSADKSYPDDSLAVDAITAIAIAAPTTDTIAKSATANSAGEQRLLTSQRAD